MPDNTVDSILKHLTGVLREGLHGPQGEFAYFSDHNPDAGLDGLLSTIDFAAASRVIGGNSIAAHVHHLTFAMRASTEWIRGNRIRPDWTESWAVSSVDETGWSKLRQRLSDAFRELEEAVSANAPHSEMAAGIALGNVAHIACHLGAIRQKRNILIEEP